MRICVFSCVSACVSAFKGAFLLDAIELVKEIDFFYYVFLKFIGTFKNIFLKY